jgi:uncharacterized protein (TIRG00374 family)
VRRRTERTAVARAARMNKKLKIILSFSVSIVFMVLSVRGVDWHQFLTVLTGVSPRSILLLVLISIAAILIRPYRWQIILSGVFPAGYWRCFNYTNIGFLANSVLPARAGELVRPVLFAQKLRISKITAIATIIVERLMDVIVLLVFLLYTFIIIDLPPWMKRGGVILIGLAALLLIILIALSRRGPGGRPAGEYLPFMPKRMREFISAKLTSFQAGLTVFHAKRDIVLTLILSGVIWISYIFSAQVILSSFSYDINSFNVSMVMMVFVSLSIMIPSSPGHFGTFQFATILGLGLYGIPKPEALAISLLVQVPIYLLNVVFGVVSLFWEGVSLNPREGGR